MRRIAGPSFWPLRPNAQCEAISFTELPDTAAQVLRKAPRPPNGLSSNGYALALVHSYGDLETGVVLLLPLFTR